MEQKKILVVDDDQFMVDILLDKLRKAGFIADGVFTGPDALEKISQEKFDLILLDLIMPGMDGMTVLKKIKSTENLKSIPVVVLTNLAEPEIVAEIKENGGSGYLVKSDQNVDEIITSIKNLI